MSKPWISKEYLLKGVSVEYYEQQYKQKQA